MLKLKPGVDCSNIQPELVLALHIAEGVFFHYGLDCVVTSLRDGVHGPHTLHQRDGICRAADLRSKLIPHETVANLLADMKAHLGRDFDVILEAVNTDNEHIHLEYDPKTLLIRKGTV